MDLKPLHRAEAELLSHYRGWFCNPELEQIDQQHKLENMTAAAREAFKPWAFEDSQSIRQAMIKLVGASSMVSLFENPRCRDYFLALSEVEALSSGLEDFLHAEQQRGFEPMLDILPKTIPRIPKCSTSPAPRRA